MRKFFERCLGIGIGLTLGVSILSVIIIGVGCLWLRDRLGYGPRIKPA